MKQWILGVLMATALSGAAMAEPPAQDRSAGFCDITPTIKVKGMPASDAIPKSNKLAKPAGKSQYAQGKLLLLTGHVYDANCHPLRGAKVEIWHADDQGKYVKPDDAAFANPYPLFAGSGVTLTDNNGAYGFETIVPASVKGKPPRVNFRILHPNIKPMTTVMYLNDVDFNKVTGKLSVVSKAALKAKTQETVVENGTEAVRAVFDVTVKGKDPYAKF